MFQPMKTNHIYITTCSLILAAVATGGVRGAGESSEAIAQLGILPPHKAPLLVTDEERNPFSDRLEDKSNDVFGLSSESQESQIRNVFASLKVNGLSKAPQGGLRVLLGDLILSEGQQVAPVIVGQTERVVVVKIAEDEIEFAWVDEHTNQLDGRKLTIPIQMAPTVEFELAGQASNQKGGKVRGVRLYLDEQAPEQGLVPSKEAIHTAEKVVSIAAPATDATDASDDPRVVKAEGERE
jgi:hypothetical protein